MKALTLKNLMKQQTGKVYMGYSTDAGSVGTGGIGGFGGR